MMLGADPLGYLISGIEVPFGMCRYNYIAHPRRAGRVLEGGSPGLPFPRGPPRSCSRLCRANDERTEARSANSTATTGRRAAHPRSVEKSISGKTDHRWQPAGEAPNDYSYSKAVMRSAR